MRTMKINRDLEKNLLPIQGLDQCRAKQNTYTLQNEEKTCKTCINFLGVKITVSTSAKVELHTNFEKFPPACLLFSCASLHTILAALPQIASEPARERERVFA